MKELRQRTNMTLKQFSDYLHIPYRTVQHWEAGTRKCPEYVKELIQYRLVQEGLLTNS